MSPVESSPSGRGPRIDSSVTSPWTHRRALLGLAPLALMLLAVIVREPWYSNDSGDTLTHFEQMRAVADHGTVGFFNGPVGLFYELCPNWFVPAHGLAWGIFPAGMSYLLAPAMRLGGFAGAVRAIWMLLGLAAAMVYALTWQLTARPAVAVVAAWTLVCGTSLAFWGTMVAPFVPAAAFCITAVYAGSRAFAATSPRREVLWAALTGMFASFALGCHLVCTIPWAGLGLVVALGPGSFSRRAIRSIAYGLGSLPMLTLMGWVNHQRFDTWNPVSYGPCDQLSCLGVNSNQTAGAFADTFAPVVPWVLVVALVLWLVRRSPRAAVIVGVVGAWAAVLPNSTMASHTAPLARALYGYVVDLGNLDMGFPRATHGPGVFNQGWSVLSLLQCSPVLACAALVGVHRRGERPSERMVVWLLAAVVLGNLFGVMLRANTGPGFVWGWPFLNLRYLTLMLPAAVVLAAVALAELPWRPWHGAVLVGVALTGALWLLARENHDQDVFGRKILHWLPLVLAAGSFTAVAAWGHRATALGGHLAALIAVLALGWGGSVTLGRDLDCVRTHRRDQDLRTAELAHCVPDHRFFLLGGIAMDLALALHDQRDILFVNLRFEPRDSNGAGARRLLDSAPPGVPAYLIEDEPGKPWDFHWPGYVFEPLPGCPRIQRIARQPLLTVP